MKKKKKSSEENKNSPTENISFVHDDEKSLGSSNAFDATENPQIERERELSDEELDELLGDN